MIKKSCPRCHTIVEINEKEYTPGERVDRRCPLCDSMLKFEIPNEKKSKIVVKEVESESAKKRIAELEKKNHELEEEIIALQREIIRLQRENREAARIKTETQPVVTKVKEQPVATRIEAQPNPIVEKPKVANHIPQTEKKSKLALGEKKAAPIVADVLKPKSDDLHSLISLFDKYTYMISLFNNNIKEYNEFIDKMNGFDNRASAMEYLKEVGVQRKWSSKESPILVQLISILKQRYPA